MSNLKKGLHVFHKYSTKVNKNNFEELFIQEYKFLPENSQQLFESVQKEINSLVYLMLHEPVSASVFIMKEYAGAKIEINEDDENIIIQTNINRKQYINDPLYLNK